MDADILIIGSGPAGLQAAVHASRGKMSVAVAGKPSASALSGAEVDNYFGAPSMSGDDLLAQGIAQAEASGAVLLGQNVMSCSKADGGFEAVLEDGTKVRGKAIIIATGISRRKLGIPGEKELFGKGVSYCAVCDCNFYKGRRVLIAGNDSEAAASAEMMTRYASETSWAFWDLEAEQSLVDAAESAGVRMICSKPIRIDGIGKVESVQMDDGTVVQTDGVFIELGARSAADLAMDLEIMPEMDDTIKVGTDCSTEVPGVFACGDVTGRPWQIARAVGQGCVAGTAAAAYVRGLR